MKKRHGNELHPLYKRWLAMNQRINNPMCPNYHRYGGRGIKIHPDIKEFLDYVKCIENLPNYDLSKSIDRIKCDGDYEPGNLRWACRSTQTANQQNSGKGFNRYTGISWNKTHNRWSARITFKGKSLLARTFHTEKEALSYRNQFISDNGLPHPIQVWTD